MAVNQVNIIISATNATGPGFNAALQNAHQLTQGMTHLGNVSTSVLNSITHNANQAAHALHNMNQQGNQLGGSGGGGGNSLGGQLGGIDDLLGALGPAAGVAGAAMAAGFAVAAAGAVLLTKAIQASIERTEVAGKIAAQTGLGKEEMAALGKNAGKVYADNFGDSLQEAGNAVRDVIRHHLLPEDASDEAIQNLTKKLLTVGKVIEEDSEAVSRAVHKMLVTGMAASSEEALDIITRGVQQGANEAGDLLDTFSEYSIQFKQLGLDGKSALGLISQGLKAGARDADTVADGLKEIAIRAQDGSKTSADAFKALGLDAKQLGKMFAQGGESARTALDMVLDKTKNIKDPILQNAIAVGLFGTKAEDLQDALFGLDLDTAAKGLGDIAGAADKAGEALGAGFGNKIEEFKRKIQQVFADIGDAVIPYLEDFLKVWVGFINKLRDAFSDSPIPGEFMDALRDLADKYAPALEKALGKLADKIIDNKAEFEELGRFIVDVVFPVLGVVLVNGLKIATVMIGGVIDAVVVMIQIWQSWKSTMLPVISTIISVWLEAVGIIVNGAAKAFGWVPGIGPKLEAAAAEFAKFAKKANDYLASIKDQDVYVRTHFVGGQGQSRGGEYRSGGVVSTAATGGIRDGMVLVGEEGPELVKLPTGSTVYPKSNTNQMMSRGGGAAVVVNLYVQGSIHSERDLIRVIRDEFGRGGFRGVLGSA